MALFPHNPNPKIINPSQKSPGFSPKDECYIVFSAREGASAFGSAALTICQPSRAVRQAHGASNGAEQSRSTESRDSRPRGPTAPKQCINSLANFARPSYFKVRLRSRKGEAKFKGDSSSGLTLTEIMVSVVLIVIVAGGLFSAFIGGQRFLIKARYRLQAYVSEKEVLDKLKGNYQWLDDSAREDLSPHKASDIGVNVSGELSRVLLNADPDTDFTYNVQGDETAPYKTVTVTLKLDWNKLE